MPENTTLELPSTLLGTLAQKAEDSGMSVPDFLLMKFGTEHVEITNVDELIRLSCEPRERTFTLNGKPLKLMVRALTAEESAMVDKLESAVIPPRDPKTGQPNEEDEAYKVKLSRARKLKRAQAFDVALLSFKIPGDDIEQKAKYLYQKLPPGVIEEIWTAIYSLTADPIEAALFT